jgi:hypothetical protein
MLDALNILVLHRMGDPKTWRESMVEKELCLPKFALGHNYLIHDFNLPVPEYVLDIKFDAIILTQTFLGARKTSKMRERMEKVYASLIQNAGFKIALPQDDYTCSQYLDDWLVEWRVDLTFPVCLNDWDVLYPRFSKFGRLKKGYTGYISDDLIGISSSRRSMQQRDIDVGYRAATLSPAYGRLGQIKTEYGKRFLSAAEGLSLNMDISTDLKDTILGTRWYDFVQNTRCMLGVNSGSSLLDRDGTIVQRVHQYQLKHPSASFEEIEAACFPAEEGRFVFTAISPRNLECALFGTAQILAPGAYGDFMDAWEDYIPLESNMSNFPEIVSLLGEYPYLQSMADRCREKLLSFQELRYQHHVDELIEEIRTNTRITHVERLKSIPLIQRYQHESEHYASIFWWGHRRLKKARQVMGDLGGRKLKYWLKNFLTAEVIS